MFYFFFTDSISSKHILILAKSVYVLDFSMNFKVKLPKSVRKCTLTFSLLVLTRQLCTLKNQ